MVDLVEIAEDMDEMEDMESCDPARESEVAPIFTPVLPGVLESASGVVEVLRREEGGRTVGVVRMLARRWTPSGAAEGEGDYEVKNN